MNHVFVDFENVQEIGLSAVPEGTALSLVVLVGEKQKSLQTDLAEQLLARASNVQLVRMGASGKNALDFTLACHVGIALAADPGGEFFIVSKDKGFDALARHLRGRGVNIARYDAFAALPFLKTVAVATALKPVAKAEPGGLRPSAKPPATPRAPIDKIRTFITNLKKNSDNRPQNEKALRTHLDNHFAGKLSKEELEAKFRELLERAKIAIGPSGAVDYSDL